MTYFPFATSLRFLTLAVGIGLSGLLAWSCGGDDDDGAGAAEDLDMQASDFTCIKDGTKVHKFFLQNPLGHLDDAVAVASSTSGGTYPVGTVIQLIPNEAMVKRGAGWSASTSDWEFFALATSASGTTINARGKEEVMNAFGGNCFDCHSKAEPQWDLVCETMHGCEPLGVSDDVIAGLQDMDPRCPQ